jgi:hypothetical protein
MPKKTKIKQAFCLRPKQPTDKVDANAVRRVLGVLSKGIVHGLGKPIPGQMCVEAAVSYSMGYEHSDKPDCVSELISDFKICLNDRGWSSDRARAKGLRRVAIAQLGSDEIENADFGEAVYRAFLAKFLPVYVKLGRRPAKKRTLKQNSTFRAFESKIAELFKKIDEGMEHDNGESLANECDEFLSSINVREALGIRGGPKAWASKRYNNKVYSYIAERAVEALKACNAKGTRYLYLIKKNGK